MGFKYKDERIFIVQPKDSYIFFKAKDRIKAKDRKDAPEQDLIIKLNKESFFRVYCTNGKFLVSNEFVRMELDEQQMNWYFRRPFEGIAD